MAFDSFLIAVTAGARAASTRSRSVGRAPETRGRDDLVDQDLDARELADRDLGMRLLDALGLEVCQRLVDDPRECLEPCRGGLRPIGDRGVVPGHEVLEAVSEDRRVPQWVRDPRLLHLVDETLSLQLGLQDPEVDRFVDVEAPAVDGFDPRESVVDPLAVGVEPLG